MRGSELIRAVGSEAFRLEALGSRFTVNCASEGEASVLRQQWSRLGATQISDPTDQLIDLRAMPAEHRGRALLTQVTVAAIEAAAGTRLMLHAAGVSRADGRVLALVGPSGMGKTTASVYLSRDRFGYVTDETVSIGPEGDVLPFGRPLWLRRPGDDVQTSPDELGLRMPSSDLRIARIVLLDRIPGQSSPPTLTAVRLVDALLELIPQASALAMMPDPLQFMSRTLDRCGGVLRLTYGEMDERVMSLLSELLGREASASDVWRAFLPPQPLRPVEPAPKRSASADDPELFHGDVSDGVATDGEALVLVDHIPVRLGGIGLAVWQAARDGVPQSQVVSIVEREHGAHPDAALIVREAVAQMVGVGLLVTGADELPMAPAGAR